MKSSTTAPKDQAERCKWCDMTIVQDKHGWFHFNSQSAYCFLFMAEPQGIS